MNETIKHKRQVNRNWDEAERQQHGQQVSDRFTSERESKIAKCIELIESLINQGIVVSQNEVARQTGLSVGFVNKYLKEIINKANQRQKDKQRKPVTVSSVDVLSKEIEHLKLTNQRLQSELKLQKRINKELLAQVAEVFELEVELETHRKQSSELIEQNRELMATVNAYKEKVSFLTPMQNIHHSNYLKNEQMNSNNSHQLQVPESPQSFKDLNEEIKAKLELLGISINSTLKRKIKSKSSSVIINAIEALKQAMTEDEIRNPSGWLANAIDNEWVKNSPKPLKEELNNQPSVYTASESESSDKLIEPSRIKSLFEGI